MLPFHKGDRITAAAGGATLLGFSAAVKGSMGIIPADAGNETPTAGQKSYTGLCRKLGCNATR